MKTLIIVLTAIIVLPGFSVLADSCFAAESPQSSEAQRKVPRISPGSLKALLDRGETALIVDVRSANAYNQSHITGALSVPVSEVESRLSRVPHETTIVFY